MQSSPPAHEDVRQRLQAVRNTVLNLHKALLDSERTAYELTRGPVGSPAAFLQLLINDPWFSWLQPMTNLIVQIDESLAAKRPLATTADFERLLVDTRALLSPSNADTNGFWKRYAAALQRDPGVSVLHDQLTAEWQ